MEIMPLNLLSRNYNNYGKHKFGQTENKGTQIFSNMPNWQNTIQGQKKDEFLSKNSKKKFNLQTIKSNKKLIITAGLLLAAIAGAVILKKNLSSTVKGGIKDLSANPQVNTIIEDTKGISENLTEKAKEFLIKDVKETGTARVNGVCFYGPDCLGKDKAIGDFLKDLSEAGYKIEKAPRAGEMSITETGAVISKLFKKAEENYKATGERTAILVRDLDKLAPERRTSNIVEVTRVLLDTQFCRERGYVWISEAADITKVDPAVLRGGRTEHFITIRPLLSEGEEVWNSYKKFIGTLANENKRNALLKEANELLKK